MSHHPATPAGTTENARAGTPEARTPKHLNAEGEMDICNGCGHALRPRGVSKADAPETRATAAKGLCMSCYQRAGGAPAQVTDMDAPCVLVRVDLRPSTYRAFARAAAERHTDVATLLSNLADRAITRKKRRPPQRVDEAELRRLNAEGLSDNRIAKHLGVAQSTVSATRRRMGLQSPTPRAPRASDKAA